MIGDREVPERGRQMSLPSCFVSVQDQLPRTDKEHRETRESLKSSAKA